MGSKHFVLGAISSDLSMSWQVKLIYFTQTRSEKGQQELTLSQKTFLSILITINDAASFRASTFQTRREYDRNLSQTEKEADKWKMLYESMYHQYDKELHSW